MGYDEAMNYYLPRGINIEGELYAIDHSNGIEWDADAVAELRARVAAGQTHEINPR